MEKLKHMIVFEKFNGEKSDKNYAELAITSLMLRDQIHIFHWQTEIGDMHRALGDFYDDLLELVDQLIESIMGKYGRFSIKNVDYTELIDLDDAKVQEYLDMYTKIYTDFRNEDFEEDTEIQNVIDEIVGLINKLKYLLTMS